MVSILLLKLGLWDGLMAPSWGITMDQTGLSSSKRTFIYSSSIFFIYFMIWINFHHKSGRVGRQPTELLFFSFMAGWEKEVGQWFQRALVGYLLIPFHWNAVPTIFTFYTFSSLVAKVREMYPEADGNYTGFKRKGAEENTYVLKVQLYLKLSHLYEIYTRVDSLSRSNDRIDGFPQQLWWQNWWMPSAGPMPLGSYLVNFGPFDLIFDPFWGVSVNIACWDFS